MVIVYSNKNYKSSLMPIKNTKIKPFLREKRSAPKKCLSVDYCV